MVKSKGLTLSFSSESSIEEELKRESTADVITIAVSSLASNLVFCVWFLICLCTCSVSLLQISYLVMFAYISLTLGDTPRLNSFYITSKV